MKIHAVNRNYTGTSAGVAFINGEGETDNPLLLEWFRTHGYTVEEAALKEETVKEEAVKEEAVEITEADIPENADRKTGKKKAGE